jgi:serine/threonine protein kinase
MYELVQGNPPFVSTSYQEIADLATNAKTPVVPECSSDFNNLLEQLLMKDPERRILWNSITSHPWLGGEIKGVEMPEQPHFREYVANKQKQNNNNNNIKFLRASQEISKDSYAGSTSMNANDRRN